MLSLYEVRIGTAPYLSSKNRLSDDLSFYYPYRLVDTIRYQLKQHRINLSWESLRNTLNTQHRTTLSMNTKNGEKCHLRVTTKANFEQQKIFDALGVKSDILGRKKTKTRKSKIYSAN